MVCNNSLIKNNLSYKLQEILTGIYFDNISERLLNQN